MASFFTDRSDEVREGGDILHTPNLTEMSANAKVNATAVTLNSPTETEVLLTIDQWFEVSFAIEDKEAAQVKRSYTLQEAYANNAAYTIATTLEQAIAALFVSFSQTVGSLAANITDDDVREAISILETNGVPRDDLAFIMHPHTIWEQLQAIDRFALLQNTAGADPVLLGAVGSLYGIPVIMSQFTPDDGAAGRYNLLASNDAVHWATSPLGLGGSLGAMVGSAGIRVQSNYVPQFLSTVTTADILYGVVENRDNAAVRIDTLG